MSTALDPATLASTEIAPITPTSLSNNTSPDASTDQGVLETSAHAIIACNSISVVACVLVIVIYALLHRKYTRIMQRTSLVLSCAMATSDLLLHVSALDRNVRKEDAACHQNPIEKRVPQSQCGHMSNGPSLVQFQPRTRLYQIVTLCAYSYSRLCGYAGYACFGLDPYARRRSY